MLVLHRAVHAGQGAQPPCSLHRGGGACCADPSRVQCVQGATCKSSSISQEAVLAQVRQLYADGVREVLLLGQNVNSYADGSALGAPPDTPRQHSNSQASTSYYAEVCRCLRRMALLRLHRGSARSTAAAIRCTAPVTRLQPACMAWSAPSHVVLPTGAPCLHTRSSWTGRWCRDKLTSGHRLGYSSVCKPGAQ